MELNAKEIIDTIEKYPQTIQIGIVSAFIRTMGAQNVGTKIGQAFFNSSEFKNWKGKNSSKIQAISGTKLEKLTKFSYKFIRKFSVYGYPAGGTVVNSSSQILTSKNSQRIRDHNAKVVGLTLVQKQLADVPDKVFRPEGYPHCSRPTISRNGLMGLHCLKKHDYACVVCSCGNHATHNFDNCWCYI